MKDLNMPVFPRAPRLDVKRLDLLGQDWQKAHCPTPRAFGYSRLLRLFKPRPSAAAPDQQLRHPPPRPESKADVARF